MCRFVNVYIICKLMNMYTNVFVCIKKYCSFSCVFSVFPFLEDSYLHQITPVSSTFLHTSCAYLEIRLPENTCKDRATHICK